MNQEYITIQNEALEQACTYIMQSSLPCVERFLLVLLLRNGLRVSEICNPSNIKVHSKYNVWVFCTKNKTWRQVNAAEAADLLDDEQVIMDLMIWKRNRQYYYRHLKGLLVGVETSRTGNEAVTHAARNIQAQQAFNATGSMQATRTSIGNASDRATEKYITQGQRMAKQTSGVFDPVSGTTANLNMTRKGVVRHRKKQSKS